MPGFHRETLDSLGLTGTTFILLSLALFVVTFAASLAVAAYVVVQLPATYFCDDCPPDAGWARRHFLLRWTFRVLKNVLGVVLVVLGILLSLPGVPGQGALTVLLGIMLLDFPGRRRLERYVVTRPSVLRTVNRLRARYGRPPLVLDNVPSTEPVVTSGNEQR
jgi:hypothetical protein